MSQPPTHSPHPALFLSLGFTAQLAQIVLLRELLTVFCGSEIALALILGCWLIWTAAGSLLALLRLPPTPAALLRRYLFATLTVCLALPLQITAIRLLRALSPAATGQYLPMSLLVLASIFILAWLCLPLGAQFALASRLRGAPQAIYIAEALGSTLAGLLATFLLIPTFSPYALAALAATAHLLLALALRRTLRPPSSSFSIQHSAFSILLLLFLMALFAAAAPLDSWTRQAYWRTFAPSSSLRLLSSTDSLYGNITILQQGPDYAPDYALYQSGRLAFSLPDRGESATLTHLCLAQHSNPQRVLLLGGGVSGMLPYVLEHPVTSIDYVELDPVLLRLARQYASPATQRALADPRVTLSFADGRAFLRHATTRYDLILVSAPEPLTAQTNRFFTREFFEQIQKCLTDDGVLCLGELPMPAGPTPELLERNATIFATLRSVFPHVSPSAADPLWLIARRSPATLDLPELTRRLTARRIDPTQLRLADYTDPNVLAANAYCLRTAQPYNPLARGTSAAAPPRPLNHDSRPIVTFQSLQLWAQSSDDRALSSLLRAAAALPPWSWFMPLAIVAISAISLSKKYRRTTAASLPAAAFALLVSGFTAMSLTLALLLAFQSLCGAVYQAIGAMLAMFMLGLAAGSLLVHAKTRLRPAAPSLVTGHGRGGALVISLFFLAALCLLCPLILPLLKSLPDPWGPWLAFALLLLLCGAATGAIFPAAAHALTPPAHSALNTQGGGHAALLYATDLLGGAAAALLTPVFLLPLFGLTPLLLTCVAALIVAALLIHLTSRPLRN